MRQCATLPFNTTESSPSVRRFDEAASSADLPDRQRLKHHNLAVQLAENLDPFPVALVRVLRRHGRVRYQTSPGLYIHNPGQECEDDEGGLAIRRSHMKHASYGETHRSLGEGGKPGTTAGDRPWCGSDGTKKRGGSYTLLAP